MLSKADSVPGQGVGSAYEEQTRLVKKLKDFDVFINEKGDKFDIFHIHSVNLRFRFRMNKKHINVVYVHFVPKDNQGSLSMPKFLTRIFDHYVESFYRAADELVVVNPYFIASLEDLNIPKERITYIPNYVNPEDFHRLSIEEINQTKAKYEIPRDKFVVLGCGQIQTRKGFDDFIKVAEENPHMFFVWAGGFSFGGITHGYKKYKKMLKNLPSNMKAIGIIERSEMNSIYNIANAFFMPSYLELFPMAILEATQLELPLVLRNLELYRPIFSTKYCGGDNVEDFSRELNKLEKDPEYYQKCMNNTKHIKKTYSEKALLEQWDKYYKTIYNKYKTKSDTI